MRTWITPVLFTVAAACLADAAQPPIPKDPKDPPPIVIKPKRAADPPPATPTPPKSSGPIIIRPGGGQPTPPAQPANPTVKTADPPQGAVPLPPLAPKADGVLFDYWFAAAVEGQRIGYLHWTAREVSKNGMKFQEGTKTQALTVARFGQRVTMSGEESTTETAEAGVLVTAMRQAIGIGQSLTLTGIVEGKTLKVRGGGAAEGAKDTPWPGGVTGIAREPQLFREKNLKAGESFEYLIYVPQVNRVVKTTTTLEAEEMVSLWPQTAPRRLLRYVSRMESVGGFKLPPSTVWCDAASFEPLRVEFDFPGLGGRVTFLRTTQAAATAPVGQVPDLFDVQSVRLDRGIPGIHTRSAAVYKVTMPKDDEPGTAFPSDARQRVLNLDAKAKSFELHVSAVRGPVRGAVPQPAPGGEFLGSSFFINWNNAQVKQHAFRAITEAGPGAGAWEKARAIERWVNRNMKAVEFSQAMATADNVAQTLSGDCTEYAMLAAAMCRAVGVPSRTVLGLVYATDRTGKPFLAYHMWFEVFAEGQWLPLDGTLGHGGVGPGHVKITDHSWHDERSFAPLLPVLRVLMSKPAFEVVTVTP